MRNSHRGGNQTLMDLLLKAPRGTPMDVTRPRDTVRTIEALDQELALVTRNIADFVQAPMLLKNPWMNKV